jgi:hypothetical protein
MKRLSIFTLVIAGVIVLSQLAIATDDESPPCNCDPDYLGEYCGCYMVADNGFKSWHDASGPFGITAYGCDHLPTGYKGTKYYKDIEWWLAVSTSATPTIGYAPLGVEFGAAVSGGTPPYTYSWTFGDGQADSGASPSHTYQNPGTYTAMVTATDNCGRWGFAGDVITAYPLMIGPFFP